MCWGEPQTSTIILQTPTHDLFIYLFRDRVSMCISGWLELNLLDDGLKVTDLPVSAYPVLGLKVCAIITVNKG